MLLEICAGSGNGKYQQIKLKRKGSTCIWDFFPEASASTGGSSFLVKSIDTIG
jgi:hypothetical protein